VSVYELLAMQGAFGMVWSLLQVRSLCSCSPAFLSASSQHSCNTVLRARQGQAASIWCC
jgi:hypothetical protein